MFIYQILRPSGYLFIKDKAKWKIDWLAPLMLAFFTSIIFSILPLRPQLFGQSGLIEKLLGFLEILPGFYLAALAAVATFDKQDLDKHMPRPVPEISTTYEGKTIRIKLTRRRMLCFLFGYLTFISVCLYLIMIIANIIYPSYQVMGFKNSYLPIMIFFVCSLVFWQMIIITFFGLYQLCDRIHFSDPDTQP